jgi:hypothetical protein
MKYGEPKEEDYVKADKAINDLEYLWECARLSETPKYHGIVEHAVKQMRRIGGIGDMLEDDVEHMHQISSRLEARVDRLKNRDKRILTLTKMEAIGFNKEIEAVIQLSKEKSKRKFMNQKDSAEDRKTRPR